MAHRRHHRNCPQPADSLNKCPAVLKAMGCQVSCFSRIHVDAIARLQRFSRIRQPENAKKRTKSSAIFGLSGTARLNHRHQLVELLRRGQVQLFARDTDTFQLVGWIVVRRFRPAKVRISRRTLRVLLTNCGLYFSAYPFCHFSHSALVMSVHSLVVQAWP